jgi:hypothetical protein
MNFILMNNDYEISGDTPAMHRPRSASTQVPGGKASSPSPAGTGLQDRLNAAQQRIAMRLCLCLGREDDHRVPFVNQSANVADGIRLNIR